MRKIHYKKVKMLMYSMIEFSQGKKKLKVHIALLSRGNVCVPQQNNYWVNDDFFFTCKCTLKYKQYCLLL